MSFISDYIQGITNPIELVSTMEGILDNPAMAFAKLKEVLPNKKQRFDEYKKLIRLHMPVLLRNELSAENLLPKAENNSWDDYIKSVDKLIKEKDSETLQMLMKARATVSKEAIETHRISVLNFDELKKRFANYLEVSIVRAGSNTAFVNIYGLMRAIPILFQNASGKVIEKAELISRITSKTTQRLLKKIMVLNSYTMNALINILWQKPVSDIGDARDKFNAYEHLYDLISLSLHSDHTKLYNPANFKFEADGIDFNSSGEHYYKAAEALHQEEKTGGCPAIGVDDLQMDGDQFNSGNATEIVCQLVGRIISLIPDEKFKELIAAPRTGYETIRQAIKVDLERIEKMRMTKQRDPVLAALMSS